MHPIHFKGWTPADRAKLAELASSPTSTFKDTGKLAVPLIYRREGFVHMVSGPITSGLTMGRPHTREENLRVFTAMIERLADEEGLDMFSQMPFEAVIGAQAARWKTAHPTAAYDFPLLYGFYRPLFSTGFVDTMHFMHGYETSIGSNWEFEECQALGIKCRMLPKEWSIEIYERLLSRTVSAH